MLVVGISGATCAGKTSLANGLVKVLKAMNLKVHCLNQDEFYFPDQSPFHEKIPSLDNHINFELSTAFDNDAIVAEIVRKRRESNDVIGIEDHQPVSSRLEDDRCDKALAAAEKHAIGKDYDNFVESLTRDLAENSPQSRFCSPSILIVEGILVFNHRQVLAQCDQRHFLTLSHDVCWERRQKRAYDPPDIPGYFQQVVWPHYLRNLEEMKELVAGNENGDGGVSYLSGENSLVDNFISIFRSVLKDLCNVNQTP